MLTFILIIIFWSILSFCGWQVSRRIFKEKKIEVLLPLSFIIGVSIYLFLLNLSSYFIPITTNFYLVLTFCLVLGIFLFILQSRRKIEKLKWSINKKETIIIFAITLVIMILTGIISAKSLDGDDLSQYHLTSAAAIAGGNFPVMELNIPEDLQTYHYGPNLLFAAIFKITNLQFWFARSLVVFLFSGVIILLCFSLARLIIKHNIKAFSVALLVFLAGGLRFIYIFPGLETLFRRFVLYESIEHPFRFLAFVWHGGPILTRSLANLFLRNYGPLGWALLLVIIFIYLNYVLKANTKKYSHAILMIVCLSVLALFIEPNFVILVLALLIYPFILFFREKDKSRLKYLIIYSFLVLFIASILVLIQGGAITAILNNLIEGKSSMGEAIDVNFFKYPGSFLSNKQPIPFYDTGFLINFGLIYLLIIPASIFFIKRWFKEGSFLILISFLFFIIPFVISFNVFWQNTMRRLFFSVNFLWAFIVGISLLTIIKNRFEKKTVIKYLIFFLMIVICLDGVIFLLSRPFYAPRLETIHEDSFFAQLKKPSLAEEKSYEWIQKNTSIKDYFLTFDDISEVGEKFYIDPTYRFVFYAQRLAPIYTEGGFSHVYEPLAKHPLAFKYREMLKICDQDILRELKYKYLLVNKNWPKGLEEKCLVNNNLELKLEAGEGEELIRIYKVL